MFLGSSCIYPRDCPQPIKEEYLLTGPLEPTNEPYAIAKIAGMKLCEAYNAPARPALHQRDADQPLRPERQLRPGEQPRPAGADPQGARGEAARRRRARRLGQRHAAARVPLRRRPGRRLRLPDGARLPGATGAVNVGTGDDVTIRELAELVDGRRRLQRRASSSTAASPTARRASCSTSAACSASAGAPATSLRDGIARGLRGCSSSARRRG